jgi:hypothetical protein
MIGQSIRFEVGPMKSDERQEVLENVCREIGRIAAGGGTFQDITKTPDFRAFTPAPVDVRLTTPNGRTKGDQPFGRWLLAQKDRGDWIDPIAAAARKDPAFPKDGAPEAVRKHLSARGADSDVFEALDDAELDWASF